MQGAAAVPKTFWTGSQVAGSTIVSLPGRQVEDLWEDSTVETNASRWELCSHSLVAFDTAWVMLLIKMMRPESLIRHAPGSSD